VFASIQAPAFHQALQRARILDTFSVAGSNRGSHDFTSNPVAGSLVGNGESPATCPCSLTLGIASVGNGSSSRDHDYAWPGAERGFENDHDIPDHFDFAGNQLCDDPVDQFMDLRSRRSGQAHASFIYL